MVDALSLGLAFVLLVAIVYLWLAQREILALRERCQAQKNRSEAPRAEKKKPNPMLGTLTTHDKVIEMYAFGESVEAIAQRLKIPQSQVKMTLKFEKIKKDGTS